TGFPAIEAVAVVGGQEGELTIVIAALDDHRRREIARQRWHRRRRYIEETERLCRLAEFEYPRGAIGLRFAIHTQRDIEPAIGKQAERQRNEEAFLLRLPWCGRTRLRQRQLERARRGVVAACRHHTRRPRLRIPPDELLAPTLIEASGIR